MLFLAGNHGVGDAWVAQIDSGGTVIWSTMLGSTVYDYIKGGAVTHGGYILVGYSLGADDDVTSNSGMATDGS